MPHPDKNLIARATKYQSREEFKANDLPGYLLAQRKRILPMVFPLETVKPDRPGIALLYNGAKLAYICISKSDIATVVTAYIKTCQHTVTNYKVYSPHSVADAIVIYHYLVNKGKPEYNTDISTDILTVHIPNIGKILGQPEEHKLT